MTDPPAPTHHLRWYERPVLVGWFLSITSIEIVLLIVAVIR